MVLLEIFTPSYIEPILADMFRACFLFIEGCKQLLSNHFVEAVDEQPLQTFSDVDEQPLQTFSDYL